MHALMEICMLVVFYNGNDEIIHKIVELSHSLSSILIVDNGSTNSRILEKLDECKNVRGAFPHAGVDSALSRKSLLSSGVYLHRPAHRIGARGLSWIIRAIRPGREQSDPVQRQYALQRADAVLFMRPENAHRFGRDHV